LSLIDGDVRHDYEWLAERQLAKGLLGYLQEQLRENGKDLADVTAIGAFKGPGSFTGLRIGLSVLNTMAEALSIPIVGTIGPNWQSKATARLQGGENDKIVLPLYGSEAHITKPRK
jgi:tRNA threonylcarbamoyladenosine biosynthesis protein TsaB